MKIYVKESDTVKLNTIKSICHRNAFVLPLSNMDELTQSDTIIVSRTDSVLSALTDFHTVIYEDFMDNIYTNVLQEYNYRHDYYYIKNALSQSKSSDITTLISGSSYGAFGIDLNYISNAVNLSSISQDLYYSQALIKRACDFNDNIKNIVICVAYYYFYSDLSLTQNQGELQRVSNLYYPLLNDSHNCLLIPPVQNMIYNSDVVDLTKILDSYSESDYLKGFFNESRPRVKYAMREWMDTSKNWQELTNEEQEYAGKTRAEQHNSCSKYTATFYENIELFQDFVNYCNNTDKNLLVAVTPATPHYLKYLNPGFKESFYSVLDNVDGLIHFVDFSDDPDFNVNLDFNDTDHLNDTGAQKFTLKLASILSEL